MEGEKVMVEQAEQVQPPAIATEQPVANGAAQAPSATEAGAPRNGRRGERPNARGIETLNVGAQMKGKVRNVVEFGAFIDIGVSRDGLAHISVLKQAGIDKTIKVGDVLDVIVRRIEPDSNRISLTLPGVEQGDSGETNGKLPLSALETNKPITGRVVRLADFGAFVDIGAQTDGLLHVSQLSSDYVRHPSEKLKVGDEVQVRILDIDPRKRRISLTMKDDVVYEPRPEPAAAEEPAERMPTAFEVAFQEAVRRQRRTRK
jgi:small subunit ribosomal protein S1